MLLVSYGCLRIGTEPRQHRAGWRAFYNKPAPGLEWIGRNGADGADAAEISFAARRKCVRQDVFGPCYGNIHGDALRRDCDACPDLVPSGGEYRVRRCFSDSSRTHSSVSGVVQTGFLPGCNQRWWTKARGVSTLVVEVIKD